MTKNERLEHLEEVIEFLIKNNDDARKRLVQQEQELNFIRSEVTSAGKKLRNFESILSSIQGRHNNFGKRVWALEEHVARKGKFARNQDLLWAMDRP